MEGHDVHRRGLQCRVFFDSIADLAHVDERRANVGLFPLDVYICIIRGMYGRDVVDPMASSTQAPPR